MIMSHLHPKEARPLHEWEEKGLKLLSKKSASIKNKRLKDLSPVLSFFTDHPITVEKVVYLKKLVPAFKKR